MYELLHESHAKSLHKFKSYDSNKYLEQYFLIIKNMVRVIETILKVRTVPLNLYTSSLLSRLVLSVLPRQNEIKEESIRLIYSNSARNSISGGLKLPASQILHLQLSPLFSNVSSDSPVISPWTNSLVNNIKHTTHTNNPLIIFFYGGGGWGYLSSPL